MAEKTVPRYSRVGNGRPPAVKAGDRFGRLTVLDPDQGRDERWNRLALFRCDCGNVVKKRASPIKAGTVKSCGCGQNKPLSERYIAHAEPTTEYVIYRKMLERCSSPRHVHFSNYGGRGITVCDRWRSSFEAFLEDMGKRPSRDHTLDRRDNDGPYSPANCRWATRNEQNQNTRRNRLVAYRGEIKTASQWAREHGIRPSRLITRLWQGWTIERALSVPFKRSR